MEGELPRLSERILYEIQVIMKRKNTVVYLSRFVIIFLSVIVQALVVWLIVYELKEKYFSVTIFLAFVGSVLFLSIVNRDQAAVYKLPWVILFIAIPFAGLMVYLTFGNVKLSKKHLRRFRGFYYEHLDEYYGQKELMSRLNAEDPRAAGEARYLRSVAYLPAFDNSDTTFLPTGEEFYACLKEELSKATKYVFLEYFIISEGKMWDGVHEILSRKIKEGVKVYVLYDDVGSLPRVPANFYKELAKEGIFAERFNPFLPVVSISHNNRDHRKIAVVDGKVGFMSGANIADEYINETHPHGRWRDNGLRIRGQAVDNLVRLFLQLYNISTKNPLEENDFVNVVHGDFRDGYILPFGDAPAPVNNEHVGENLYLDIINRAEKYLYIATPYFIVDTPVVQALRCAACRGVDVRIVLPGVPDKKIINIMTRSFYPSLLSAGVKIYHFKGGFIHSKTVLADGETAVVGTINFDYRSFVHHFECGCWLYKTSSINAVYEDFCNLFANESESVPVNYRLRWYESLIKSVLNLFAPLM